jgi:hypothetical protein
MGTPTASSFSTAYSIALVTMACTDAGGAIGLVEADKGTCENAGVTTRYFSYKSPTLTDHAAYFTANSAKTMIYITTENSDICIIDDAGISAVSQCTATTNFDFDAKRQPEVGYMCHCVNGATDVT